MAPTLRAALFALSSCLVAGPDALAQGRYCSEFFDDITADIGLGTVTAGPRTPFFRDGPGCPADTADCRERAYLVPGDEVLLLGGAADAPGFVCALYANPRGLSRAGWLPEGAVARKAPGPAVSLEDWLGDWRKGPEQRIAIRRSARPGLLRVEGEATWGASDPERVRRGGVHSGEVSGEAAPTGPLLGFTTGADGTRPYDDGESFDCRIRLRLVGAWLLAEDNGNCGGANVSFSGAYRRAPRGQKGEGRKR